MKKAKMILDRFLHPPKRIIGTVPTASFAALIFVFASHREESAAAYPIFLLSAYSLVILLAALPALAGRLVRPTARCAAVFCSMTVLYIMRAYLAFRYRCQK
ncbi:hypothetical protein B5F17_06190 [Butyricicoccus pullicaecorum]|uniref:Uncharacterized protein n=1 Tax=Butyricicoccus pullicaecorum TaxID=501571 RepID=A0A1Y4L8V2_9FIRM|nr:hypothetical protein B5F17_06190 [Butyricicoccus pullicaecorum]